MNYYKEQCQFLGNKAIFHGFLGKDEVHELLAASHFLLLPSDSEGFPKVIAEGACYGVIPVVSNVGSIGHYVNEGNGFVWDIKSNNSYHSVLLQAIETDKVKLKEISKNGLELAEKFTFENYLKKLNRHIFDRENKRRDN